MAPFLRIVASLALAAATGAALVPSPAARAASPPVAPQVSVDQTRLQPGQIVTVSARGFRPGTAVAISLGGIDTGSGGNYGTAVVDRSGRFSMAVLLLCYPDGSPLRPGAVVLVAHDPTYTQKATVPLQIVAPKPAASRAAIQLPAAGAAVTFPSTCSPVWAGRESR